MPGGGSLLIEQNFWGGGGSAGKKINCQGFAGVGCLMVKKMPGGGCLLIEKKAPNRVPVPNRVPHAL